MTRINSALAKALFRICLVQGMNGKMIKLYICHVDADFDSKNVYARRQSISAKKIPKRKYSRIYRMEPEFAAILNLLLRQKRPEKKVTFIF